MTDHQRLASNTLASLAQGILVITLAALAFKDDFSKGHGIVACVYLLSAAWLYVLAHVAVGDWIWKLLDTLE